MRKIKPEIKIALFLILAMFTGFLVVPLLTLFIRSLQSGEGIGISNYIKAIGEKELIESIINSVKVSGFTAVITTTLAFILAYTLNYTNVSNKVKIFIKSAVAIPMLLPTITYGFAIIYSFGKQGLITNLFGKELFQIYGFNGLLIGYVIYTLPAAFLLINNSFKYIDKKFLIVSKLMGDNEFTTFKNTVLRPLVGTIGGAFVLSFIASFTDFGIPASIGGTYNVVSSYLYQVMLGAIPDFNNGAVIAVLMLLPAVLGVILLNYLEKFNFHYDKFTQIDLPKNKLKDWILGGISTLILIGITSIFAVMFIVPFVESYPYNMTPTLRNFIGVIKSNSMGYVYKNSLIIAVFSALIGTIVSYTSAIINVRTPINKKGKLIIDGISMITNTVPGMVLGIGYLLFFNNSSLKGSFVLIILCNIVHFFTTPYLMAKNSLSKINPSLETTGELMGDNFIKTILRVVVPNTASTVIEMFSYYFIQSMVTVSAIIFLVSPQTAVVTTKIKELQHYAKFNDVFALSLLIFLTNVIVKVCCDYAQKKYRILK